MVGGQVLDLEAEGKVDPTPRPPPPRGEGESEKRPLPPAPSPTGRGGEKPGLGSSSPSLPRGGGRGEGSVSSLEAIHRWKTGALFRSAVRLGVYAAQAERPAGADPKTLAAADEYAAALGLLFQVTDDLLDAEGSADKAGKRVGKDAGRGKLTYPGLLGVDESRRRAAELGRRAVAAAGKLGSGPLARLAEFVVERDR
ncbi:MAG: polyprenyl synthetase family protein [Gemmataceae bacterium]|nr:polyprenyl synthetase family protein [Gemmataceae bacterium]